MPGPLPDITITDHARLEMDRRQIDEATVRAIVANPEQVVKTGRGRWIYQSRLRQGDARKMYIVRVIVDLGPSPPEVVTAYRSSKIEKYWRQQ